MLTFSSNQVVKPFFGNLIYIYDSPQSKFPTGFLVEPSQIPGFDLPPNYGHSIPRQT